MKDDSLYSLIILLVLFFVLPSVLKLLGRYTMRSKNVPRREEESQEYPISGEGQAPYQEHFPASHDAEMSGQSVPNEPIHPKWF